MKTKKRELILKGNQIQIILYGLLFILLIALILQYNFISNPLKLFIKEKKEIDSKDICSIIGGKIIHTIKDEESCQNKCFADCESSKLNLEGYEFKNLVNNCNECKCYCTE